MRQRILTSGPWSSDERLAILDYCQSDVEGLARLFIAMLARWPLGPVDLERVLVRGRYVATVAKMEYRGVPIDANTLGLMRDNWQLLKRTLIEETDRAYGVYDQGSFRTHLFERYLKTQDITWPRLESGMPQLDYATFKSMALRYPKLEELRQLRKTVAAMGEIKLTVGRIMAAWARVMCPSPSTRRAHIAICSRTTSNRHHGPVITRCSSPVRRSSQRT